MMVEGLERKKLAYGRENAQGDISTYAHTACALQLEVIFSQQPGLWWLPATLRTSSFSTSRSPDSVIHLETLLCLHVT